MSIVAGIRCSDGIVLCADSLHTGNGYTVLEPKMAKTECPCGTAIYGFAGNPSFARTAIMACHTALLSAPPEADMVQILAREVSREFRRLVLSVPTYAADYSYHYRLLIGIRLPNGYTDLLTTEGHSLSYCGGNYTCIGTDDTLALYLLRSLYRSDMNVDRALIAAAHMIGRVKSYVPHCGGPTQFLWLTEGESKPEIAEFHLSRLEEAFTEIERRTSEMLIDNSDTSLSLEEMSARLLDFHDYIWERRKRLTFGIDFTALKLLGLPHPKDDQ
jgi:20S proteasome alpha/beta subunit